jgi:hypothetical protein
MAEPGNPKTCGARLGPQLVRALDSERRARPSLGAAEEELTQDWEAGALESWGDLLGVVKTPVSVLCGGLGALKAKAGEEGHCSFSIASSRPSTNVDQIFEMCRVWGLTWI